MTTNAIPAEVFKHVQPARDSFKRLVNLLYNAGFTGTQTSFILDFANRAANNRRRNRRQSGAMVSPAYFMDHAYYHDRIRRALETAQRVHPNCYECVLRVLDNGEILDADAEIKPAHWKRGEWLELRIKPGVIMFATNENRVIC